jgi:hypothetical protein
MSRGTALARRAWQATHTYTDVIPERSDRPRTVRVQRQRGLLATGARTVLVFASAHLLIELIRLAGGSEFVLSAGMGFLVLTAAAYVQFASTSLGTTWYAVPGGATAATDWQILHSFETDSESFPVYARKPPGTFRRRIEHTQQGGRQH